MTRQRVAPMATRTANSRARATPRARKRVVRLVQVRSSSSRTQSESNNSGRRISPAIYSLSRRTSTPSVLSESGY